MAAEEDLLKQMESMARRLFRPMLPAQGQAYVRRAVWFPPTDVYETEDEIVLLLEIGGIGAGEFEVKVDGPQVTVAGRRRRPCDPCERLHHVEIDRGEFYREIRLNFSPDPDAVRAAYRDGILEIRIPKPKARPEVQISVQGG
ncbi:MAG: Hsp20/alpha crystallin family protein [Planctomycetes bacterium]|nr:Hsp20/alpha crystallin family protein [Planctomycetota bacterium]